MTKKIRRMDLGKMHEGGESAELPYMVTPRGVRFRLLDWEERVILWPESQASNTNVIHMRAAHTSELRTPPNLLILNVFILTKTPLNSIS